MEFLKSIISAVQALPFITIIVAFVIGMMGMPYVLKVSIRKQMVVRPNKRTSHKGNIPNVGGINIYTSFLLTFLIFSVSMGTSSFLNYFLGGLYLVFFVGFLDDLMAFSALKKFLGELIAGFILIVLADVRLTNLHGFLWIEELSGYWLPLSYLVSFFLFLLIINGLNLIDGVDGLATGIGMVICLFFGVYFQLIDETNLSIMAYSLIGALAIFFIYNVFGKRTKIFMGDSGSLVLGYIVYVLVVKFCEWNILESNPFYVKAAPAIAFCVLAVPLFDTMRVMVTRIKKGHSLFTADKNHVHHLLLSIGLKHRQVTFVLVLVNVSFIILALLGRNWPNIILGVAAVVLAVIYTLLLWHLVDASKTKHQKNEL